MDAKLWNMKYHEYHESKLSKCLSQHPSSWGDPPVLWFHIDHCSLLHTHLYKSQLWCHSAYRPQAVSRVGRNWRKTPPFWKLSECLHALATCQYHVLAEAASSTHRHISDTLLNIIDTFSHSDNRCYQHSYNMLQYLSCRPSSALSITLAKFLLISCYNILSAKSGAELDGLVGWWASNTGRHPIWSGSSQVPVNAEPYWIPFKGIIVSSCFIMFSHGSSLFIVLDIWVRESTTSIPCWIRFHRYPATCSIPSCDRFSFKVLPSWKLSTETCIFIWVPIFGPSKNIKEPSIMDSPWAWPNVHHCLRCSKASSMNWTLATC